MKAVMLAAMLASAVVIGWPSGARAAILEQYAVRAGAEESSGVRAVLRDTRFGGGTAQSRLEFIGSDGEGSGTLYLRVWRTVADDEIVFALLVFRVEIRGYDAAGTVVYFRRLPGFTFGDSASGDWRRAIPDLPAETLRIAVTFYGNYE